MGQSVFVARFTKNLRRRCYKMKEDFKNLVLGESNLAEIELEKANKKWPMFNSPHEAYGVVKEELEEVEEEYMRMNHHLKEFWESVKTDTSNVEWLKLLKEASLNCAAESVQVAAMAQKAIDSL